MKQFTSVKDIQNLSELVEEAIALKQNPTEFANWGRHKTLVLLFFNPSLRTRLSTQKAGFNLGMSVISMNVGQAWKLEFEDHVIMNTDKAEHIKEAAAVISQYADIIGIRTFPSLIDRQKDYDDFILNRFIECASVPVISMESAILHPLQSFADVLTIEENKKQRRPKVVLSWAPHPRALPQAVANSFIEWMQLADVDLSITHPKGYELAPKFAKNILIEYEQNKAFEGADFIYVKNWSAYNNYGKILSQDKNWMITQDKMALTNKGKLMHCLPVRRNVVVAGEVLDGPQSLVIEQANNRTFAAQTILKKMLTHEQV